MAYGGLNKQMGAAAEFGRNPVSKHQIQPAEYGDEQADAGRGCRTRLARPNSQARTRTRDHTRAVSTPPMEGESGGARAAVAGLSNILKSAGGEDGGRD